MPYLTKRSARGLAISVAAAVGVSGCVTDPAFMEGLAMAMDGIAAETAYMAEDARCYRHLSSSGEWVTLCPLPYGQVAPPPRVRPPHHGRDRGRDRGGHRDRRDGKRGSGW
jgi:hypothetical protein